MSKVWPEPQPRVNISRGICLQKSYKERTTRQVFLSETFQKTIFEFLRSRNGADVPNLSGNSLAVILERMPLNKIVKYSLMNDKLMKMNNALSDVDKDTGTSNVVVHLSNLAREKLQLRSGDALAITMILQQNHLIKR